MSNEREIKVGSKWQNKRCSDITATILDIDNLGVSYRYEDNAMESLTEEFFETFTHISDPEPEQEAAPEEIVDAGWEEVKSGKICTAPKYTIKENCHAFNAGMCMSAMAKCMDIKDAEPEVTKPSAPTDEDHGIEFGREYVDETGWVFVPNHIFKDSLVGYSPLNPNDAVIARLKGFNIRYLPHNWEPAHKWKDGDEAWWVIGNDEDPEEILNGRYYKGEFRCGCGERYVIKPEWKLFPTPQEAAQFAVKEWGALEAALKMEKEVESK